jgi:hypothetical protein
MTSTTRRADEFKSAIRSIIQDAEAPMKRFVLHYILWNQGISGFPPRDSGPFQCACDELVLEGFMTANKTARGVTYERNTVTATEPATGFLATYGVEEVA